MTLGSCKNDFKQGGRITVEGEEDPVECVVTCGVPAGRGVAEWHSERHARVTCIC